MTNFADLQRDSGDLGELVNENKLVATRYGGNKKSWQYLLDQFEAEFAQTLLEINKSRGYRVVGAFAAGFDYELFNDVGIDASGKSWIYVGTGAPVKTVSAGTVPSAPDYQQVTYNSIDGVVGLRDELNGFANVQDMRSGINAQDSGNRIEWRGYYSESDGGGNWGVVKTGDSTSLVDDGGSIFVIVNDAVNGVWVEANLKDEKINLRKFGATPDLADCSDIIIGAIAYCADNNKALYAPAGKYRYSKDITFNCSFFGDGTELTHLCKIAPATIYITKDDFKGVRVAPETDEIMAGDTSNGVIANDIWRKRIEVRTEYHGGDGFIFERGNLSQVVVYTNRNGGRGYVAAEDPISGDNNCVDMWIEASRNTSTGFEIESSTTDSHKANCLRGYVISQTNGTTGDPDKDYNVILDGFNHSDLMIYAEFGGNSVWLKEGLGGSDIFLSVASVGGIRDDLTTLNTNTISYTPGARGDRRTKSIWLESLKIKNGVDVGNLELKQTGDRAFELNAEGSGSTQTLKVGSTLSLVNSDSTPYTIQEFKGATLNFGTLLANGGTGELTVTLNNPLPANIGVVYANPAYSLPNGIVYNCYMQDDSTVIIRCTNVTSGDILIPQGAWRVAAMNHG